MIWESWALITGRASQSATLCFLAISLRVTLYPIRLSRLALESDYAPITKPCNHPTTSIASSI
jgi:hypothetical protein